MIRDRQLYIRCRPPYDKGTSVMYNIGLPMIRDRRLYIRCRPPYDKWSSVGSPAIHATDSSFSSWLRIDRRWWVNVDHRRRGKWGRHSVVWFHTVFTFNEEWHSALHIFLLCCINNHCTLYIHCTVSCLYSLKNIYVQVLISKA